MTHLDLFSGIGGFSLGLKPLGIKQTLFSEIDKHASAIYKHQFPNATELGDVQHINSAALPSIDIITFGSPCQDFSLAGKRHGIEGQRSGLIRSAIKLIRELRPRIFIWENVKGAYSTNAGADFAAILQAFADIGGYRIEWQLLNTRWVLPQNRERIYLIGHLGDGSERAVFPIRNTDCICTQSRANTEKVHTGNRCALTQTARQYASWNGTFVRPVLTPDRAEKRQNGRRIKEHNEPAHTLTAQDRHGVLITSATQSGYEVATVGDAINYSHPNSKTRRGRVGKQTAQTLDTNCHQATMAAHNQIRRLTEIECEKLQGFPGNWTQYGNYNGTIKSVSSTQRYKCLGNAVTVDVVEIIGRKLKELT